MDLIDRQAAIDILEVAINDDWEFDYAKDRMIELSTQPESKLVTWLLDWIWDEGQWELNWQAFPELLCRKLVTLGYLREKDGEYER